MRLRLIGVAVGLSLAAALMGTSPASAATAAGGFRVKAVVVSIRPEACGRVLVMLSAITPTAQHDVRFKWDLNGDGTFDTQANPDSRGSHLYVKSATDRVTATV